MSTKERLQDLYSLQVSRKFWIKSINRQKNALGALIRQELEWSPDLPEREASAILRRAASIVSAGLKGEVLDGEDGEIIEAFGDEFAGMAAALAPMEVARHNAELSMKRIVRKLPVYTWAKDVKGFGEIGLAVVLGEIGDPSNYPKKGHLWKRLGLAPYEGKAYSTWRGSKEKLSKEEWINAGYSPRRRAEVYSVVSEPLFRAQTVAQGPYRAIYDARRDHTAITHPDWTKGHSHMDALRKMTKILLRDMWQEWRSLEGYSAAADKANVSVPTSEQKRAA